MSAPTTNTAFVLHGIQDARFEVRPVPDFSQLSPTHVVVLPKKTTICGSDSHYMIHGRIGDFVVTEPMVLGHESSGEVLLVGKDVKGLKVGDRVALEPGDSCRSCHSCAEGHYERCPDMIFAATPPHDGTLQGYYTLPASLCYKLPDSVSLESGALLEPLSVAVMAVSKVGQMAHAASVVVFGAGPVGLLTMAVAKGLGARRVIAVDIQEERLKFAKKYAADDYILPSKMTEGEDRMSYSRRQAQELRDKFGFEERGPNGVDLVIDCTGAEICIQTGLFVARHGGTFVQVGMGAENVSVPITQILTKELTVKGSFRYGPGCYRLALDLVARGKVDLAPLITHRYTFKEADVAFLANQQGKGADGVPLIKAVIDGPL